MIKRDAVSSISKEPVHQGQSNCLLVTTALLWIIDPIFEQLNIHAARVMP
jgi:hypothetical protein